MVVGPRLAAYLGTAFKAELDYAKCNLTRVLAYQIELSDNVIPNSVTDQLNGGVRRIALIRPDLKA